MIPVKMVCLLKIFIKLLSKIVTVLKNFYSACFVSLKYVDSNLLRLLLALDAAIQIFYEGGDTDFIRGGESQSDQMFPFIFFTQKYLQVKWVKKQN